MIGRCGCIHNQENLIKDSSLKNRMHIGSKCKRQLRAMCQLTDEDERSYAARKWLANE